MSLRNGLSVFYSVHKDTEGLNRNVRFMRDLGGAMDGFKVFLILVSRNLPTGRSLDGITARAAE